MKKSFDNCILYLPFDNSLDDISGNANNGVPNGAPLSYENYGISGPNLTLNGIDQYISSPITPTTNTENWTISIWLKPIQITGDSLVFMCGDIDSGFGIGISSDEGFGLAAYGIERFGDYNIVFCAYGGVGWFNTGVYIPRINAWNHLAIRRNDVVTELFLNGSKTSWTLSESPITPENGYLVGGDSSLQYQYDNALDELQLYDRALTDEEIKELYHIAIALKFEKKNVKLAIRHKFIKEEVNPVTTKKRIFAKRARFKPSIAKGLRFKDILDHKIEIRSNMIFIDAHNFDKENINDFIHRNFILTQGPFAWEPRINEHLSKSDSFKISEYLVIEKPNINTFNFFDYTCLDTTNVEKQSGERAWASLISEYLATEKVEFAEKRSQAYLDGKEFADDTYRLINEKANVAYSEYVSLIRDFKKDFSEKLIAPRRVFLEKSYVDFDRSWLSVSLKDYLDPAEYINNFNQIKNKIDFNDLLNCRKFNGALQTDFSDIDINKGVFVKDYSEHAISKNNFTKTFTMLEHLSNIFIKEYIEKVSNKTYLIPNEFSEPVSQKAIFTISLIDTILNKRSFEKPFNEIPTIKELLKVNDYIDVPVPRNFMETSFINIISLKDKINPIFNEVPHVRDKIVTTFNEVPNIKHLLKTGFANIENSNIKLLDVKYAEVIQLKKLIEKRFTDLLLTNKHISKPRLYAYNLENKELARRPLGSFIKMRKDLNHGYVSQSFIKFVKDNFKLEKTVQPDLTMRMLVICAPWRK